MTRYALVNASGVAENIIEWDGTSEWSPPEGLTAIPADDGVSMNWTLEEGAWTAPAPEDPEWT